jgi:hypothetical protein
MEIKEVKNTKYLGLGLDKHMEWKTHINVIIPKMSSICYVIRSMYSICNITTLKITFYGKSIPQWNME